MTLVWLFFFTAVQRHWGYWKCQSSSDTDWELQLSWYFSTELIDSTFFQLIVKLVNFFSIFFFAHFLTLIDSSWVNFPLKYCVAWVFFISKALWLLSMLLFFSEFKCMSWVNCPGKPHLSSLEICLFEPGLERYHHWSSLESISVSIRTNIIPHNSQILNTAQCQYCSSLYSTHIFRC